MKQLVDNLNYSVSQKGEVCNLRNGRMLKGGVGAMGYPVVMIKVKGKNKLCTIHRLVAKAYIPNPFNLPFVNHIDGSKTNNNVSNLEWVTDIQNKKHAVDIGLTPKGSDHPHAKLNDNDVHTICSMLEEGRSTGYILSELKLPISRATLLNIRSGRDWKHISKDYTWDTYEFKRNKLSKKYLEPTSNL